MTDAGSPRPADLTGAGRTDGCEGKGRNTMGRHEARRARGGYGGVWPHDRRLRTTVDPGDRTLVEPDRDAEATIPADERDARVAVHTDRDPHDDVHQANESPGPTSQG